MDANEMRDLLDGANEEMAELLPVIEIAGHFLVPADAVLDMLAVMAESGKAAYDKGAGDRALGFLLGLTMLHQGLTVSVARAEVAGL